MSPRHSRPISTAPSPVHIDKRSAARRADERSIHPLRTLGNLLFMGALLAVLYGALAIGILVQSSILEF